MFKQQNQVLLIIVGILDTQLNADTYFKISDLELDPKMASSGKFLFYSTVFL